jgi:hypothetical protein
MGFTDQANHPQALIPAAPPLTRADLLDEPEPLAIRVNGLFSGVLLGACGWLLVLGVIFAVAGSWIVAGALLGASVLCVLPVWRASRRLRSVS